MEFSTELYQELASRRALNKAAEQTRRDQISSAIDELGGLLPPKVGVGRAERTSGTENSDAGRSTKSAPLDQRNSKVGTLKEAIVYVKLLQRDVANKERLLKDSMEAMEIIKRGRKFELGTEQAPTW